MMQQPIEARSFDKINGLPSTTEEPNPYGQGHINPNDKTMPIAIIGMSCRFPGAATNVEKLWELCSQGRSAWSEIPSERFNASAFYHPNKGRNGTMNTKGGYFLCQDVSCFDSQFFSISSDEAKAMDPQQRIMLECVYEALENAGLPMRTVAGSNTSVFTASFTKDYEDIILKDPENAPLYQSTGTAHSILANRISYFFNLKGPSIAIDTACSGSLVALHLACQSLRSSESKQAIVGGANIILNPDIITKMTPMGFFSPDGKCYTFDDRATGYARGEGVASIILKPLADATRDGDTIRAVIRESVVNQDGRTAGITLPSQKAQESLIKSAYISAGLNPLETGYVEAHGTGTPAGDPIEAAAIASVFGPGRPAGEPLLIGSIKTNVGHMEGASGLGGIIKSVLILEKGFIPPNLNFENANPRIPLGQLKLKVPLHLQPWPSNSARRISVNSFGFGGTNAHVILEDFQHYQSLHKSKESRQKTHLSATTILNLSVPEKGHRQVFVLSSNDQDTCELVVKNLVGYLRGHEESQKIWFSDLAYTLNQRRSLLPWKLAVSATSPATLIEAFEGVPRPTRSMRSPKLGFVFTGQGAQWYAMARELIDAYPIFRSSLEMADRHLKSFGASWSIFIELGRDAQSTRVNIASISQPLSTAIQIALVDLLKSWGITPVSVVGHSSGEAAAAYAGGALSMKSALSITYFKGLLTTTLKDKAPHLKGAMMAVGLSKEDVETHISTIKSGSIVVACINSPFSITVSGDAAAIDELHSRLEPENVFVRKLKIDTAYHSFHMQAISDDYLKALGELRNDSSSDTKIFSSVTGELIESSELDGLFWVKHMVSPVRFSQALHKLCLQNVNIDQQQPSASNFAVDILIEIGPHSALAGPIKQILKNQELEGSGIVYAPSLVRNTDAVLTTHQLACTLVVHGYPVDLDAVNYPTSNERRHVIIDLPPYPWNHSLRHWQESRLSLNHRFRHYPRHDLLGAPVIDFNESEPKWRNIIRISDMPWVKDHKIQGTILYPAGGFIVMALEAIIQCEAQQNRKVTGYKLRDVSFSKALVIPENSDGVETSFALRPFVENALSSSATWREFRVFSYNPLERCWNEHCRGLISAQFDSQPTEVDGGREARHHEDACKLRFANSRSICKETVVVQDLYKSLDIMGLQFGSTFRNLVNIQRGPGQALCTISIPDTAAVMPQNFQYSHLVHPATLDAALQPIFPALTSSGSGLPELLMLPTHITEIYIAQDINSSYGHQFLLHAAASRKGSREAEADVVVIDASLSESVPVIEIKGFQCTRIGSGDPKDEEEEEMKPLCFKLCWELDVDLINEDIAKKLWGTSKLDSVISENIPYLEQTAFYYIQDALAVLTDSDYQKMEHHHQLFYNWMKLQDLSAKEGIINHVTPQVLTANAEERMTIFKLAETSSVDGRLLCRIGKNLVRILRKEVEPLALMLEDNLLYEFYATDIGSIAQMAGYVDKLAFKHPRMNILEIGAGTGSGTLPVLKMLGGFPGKEARFSKMTYTDISTGFFEKAQTKFSDWGDLISYKKLDIEYEPESQGFQSGTYDLIIAVNVLHATRNMHTTMKNVRKLLKRGGKLILVEITRPMLRVSAVFGTLPGWWLGVEETRKFGPTLTESQWGSLLGKYGFNLDLCLPDFPAEQDHMNSLIVSTAMGQHSRYLPVSIIHDGTEIGVSIETLVSSLETLTELDLMVTVTTLEEAQVDGKVCIFLCELHDPILNNPRPSQFDSIKYILSTAEGVLWVSRGGTLLCEKPDASLITGLLRTIRLERQASRFATLDLDAQTPLSDVKAAKAILEVFAAVFDATNEKQELDVEFSERNGKILIPRVLEDISMNKSIVALTRPPKPEVQAFHQPGRFLSLEIGTPGLLDTLRFVDNPVMALPLAEENIEVETNAASLNFRDIMIAMGQIPPSHFPMGSEFSGVITRIGKNVTNLNVGDRVCGWATNSSAFSNSVQTLGVMVQRIPDDMTFETAVSIPTAYCTVSISLCDTARLQRGETILIQAAAGAVGQVAIMFARLIGAEIFATVGSTNKKRFLIDHFGIPESHIFSSRDTSFARGIMIMTKNKGVDVILNSLAGEALQQAWQCLARFGRFIELGKRDMVINSHLYMKPFLRNVTFASVDLATIIQHRVSYAAKAFAHIMKMFQDKELEPIYPITSFSFSEIEAAFRFMSAGKHIGKIVLVVKPDDRIKAFPVSIKPYFRSNASYLLVGGLGGLGRSISSWMVGCGVKNIIFLSRSNATNESARAFLRTLEEGGVNVATYTCDISNEDQLAEALKDSAKQMPPISGVIQSALVLKDTPFGSMSFEKYKQVIFPKVRGSWNLHKQLSHLKLDFFVMLSSSMGIVGNGGQANYSASSSFQDALAHYRNAQNLPAVTLDVGYVAGAGYVFENEEAKKKVEKQGFIGIPVNEFLAILQYAITQPARNSTCQIITGLHAQNIVDMKLGKPVIGVHLWLRDPKFSHLLSTATKQLTESHDIAINFGHRLKSAATFIEASHTVCQAITEKLSKFLLVPKESIEPTVPITSCGVDSLVAVELRNWILRELFAEVPTFDILGNSSLLELSCQVAKASKLLNPALFEGTTAQNGLDVPASVQSFQELRVQKMHALVEKYSRDLPSPALSNGHPVGHDDSWTVVLTGSTGSVGSYLLESLLMHPKVVKIICLNRSAGGVKRQIEINSVRGLTTNLPDGFVEFYQINYGEQGLGLAPEKYELLRNCATHIIHNAWRVDLVSSIETFEVQIYGVRQLLDLSLTSAKNARVIFFSSIAAILRWPDHYSDNAPEDIVNDYSAASDFGYGESKQVAEHLLCLANARSGVPVSVIRLGQIGGPVKRQGVWNKNEWLPGIIAGSNYLRLLPDSLSIADAVNWIPIDSVSNVIIEIIETADMKQSNTFEVFNVVNPHVTPWKTLLPTVEAHLTGERGKMTIVTFNDWVNALQKCAMKSSSVPEEIKPALSLLPLYRRGKETAVGSIAKLETARSVAASRTLATLETVKTEWMSLWLKQWDF